MPSVLWHGYRWRAVFSTLHRRRPEETFHEFLVSVVQWTLGEPWWKHQIRMAEADRHVVVKWKYEFAGLIKGAVKDATGPPYSTTATGPAWSLLSLGYDLFCLQTKDRLPKFVADRLTKNASFQSARYEVAIAAIMMRAGFDIRFLDNAETSERHCELIATHRECGVQVGVEAKSRRRRGVIHEPGQFLPSEDARGLEQLVRKAKKQKPEGLPFLIFVDINLPPSIEPRFEGGVLMRDVPGLLDRLGRPSPEAPEPFNALFVTNYSYHYGNAGEGVPKAEWNVAISPFPQTPLDGYFLQLLMETLGRYGAIPEEV